MKFDNGFKISLVVGILNNMKDYIHLYQEGGTR
jgi:hypothetical protein